MNYKEIDLNLDYKAMGLENGGYSPKLTLYGLENSSEIDMNRVRPLVLICPGGGYTMTSDREAEAVALQFLSAGFHAMVLRYSIAPAVFPAALVEVASALKLARDHAKEWHIDENRIFVAGFSAGGHLACSMGVFWNEPFLSDIMGCEATRYQPNGMILSYPVITSGEFCHSGSFVNLLGDKYDEKVEELSLEHRVNKHTPPAFIWHTFEDDVVPVENALLLASALRKNNVPFELHIYPHGGHGIGLATEETMNVATGYGVQEECQSWIELAKAWIHHQ